jgi:hypothetical protein
MHQWAYLVYGRNDAALLDELLQLLEVEVTNANTPMCQIYTAVSGQCLIIVKD